MKLNLAAKYSRTENYTFLKNELLKRSLKALESCKFKVIETNDKKGLINAKTKFNFWSSTEVILLEVSDYKVKIISRCFVPTQFIDWGKNRRNVNKFFKNLNLKIDNKN